MLSLRQNNDPIRQNCCRLPKVKMRATWGKLGEQDSQRYQETREAFVLRGNRLAGMLLADTLLADTLLAGILLVLFDDIFKELPIVFSDFTRFFNACFCAKLGEPPIEGSAFHDVNVDARMAIFGL